MIQAAFEDVRRARHSARRMVTSKSGHKGLQTVAAVLGVAALGLIAYEVVKPKATNPNTTSGSYWASLSPTQQQAYQAALYSWGQTATANGTYPAAVQAMAAAGITSAASLTNPGNLALLTDAYQTANNVGASAGVVDQQTFQAVTGQ